jgi:RNA polymerase-binding protein DksA
VNVAVDGEQFRKRLLDERSRAQGALNYLHDENPGSIDDELQQGTADNHPADVATVTFDRELDYSLEENEERLLGAIDAALVRIGNGTFGICSTCGHPVGGERLEALPWTTQCIDCKRKEERG